MASGRHNEGITTYFEDKLSGWLVIKFVNYIKFLQWKQIKKNMIIGNYYSGGNRKWKDMLHNEKHCDLRDVSPPCVCMYRDKSKHTV